MADYYPEYEEFVELFNEGRYPESHEVLLEIWQINPSNTFYKGLIQLAGAYNHWTSNSFFWAESLFRSAADLLQAHAPEYQGLDIQEIVTEARRCAEIAHRRRANPDGEDEVPRMTLHLRQE